MKSIEPRDLLHSKFESPKGRKSISPAHLDFLSSHLMARDYDSVHYRAKSLFGDWLLGFNLL
jgi:hypothetical protein